MSQERCLQNEVECGIECIIRPVGSLRQQLIFSLVSPRHAKRHRKLKFPMPPQMIFTTNYFSSAERIYIELAIFKHIKPLHLRQLVQFHEELIKLVNIAVSITIFNGFPHFIGRILGKKGPVVDSRIFFITAT